MKKKITHKKLLIGGTLLCGAWCGYTILYLSAFGAKGLLLAGLSMFGIGYFFTQATE